MTTREPGVFETKFRVRLSETDALGVVYYGQYYAYFDLARLEMLRRLGITPAGLSRRRVGFVAAAASSRYHSPARFDDALTATVQIERVGGSSVSYLHTIRRGRSILAEGRVTDVMIDADGNPQRIPLDMRKKLARHLMARSGRGSARRSQSRVGRS